MLFRRAVGHDPMKAGLAGAGLSRSSSPMSHFGTRHSVTVASPSGIRTLRRSILKPPSGIEVSISSEPVCMVAVCLMLRL